MHRERIEFGLENLKEEKLILHAMFKKLNLGKEIEKREINDACNVATN